MFEEWINFRAREAPDQKTQADWVKVEKKLLDAEDLRKQRAEEAQDKARRYREETGKVLDGDQHALDTLGLRIRPSRGRNLAIDYRIMRTKNGKDVETPYDAHVVMPGEFVTMENRTIFMPVLGADKKLIDPHTGRLVEFYYEDEENDHEVVVRDLVDPGMARVTHVRFIAPDGKSKEEHELDLSVRVVLMEKKNPSVRKAISSGSDEAEYKEDGYHFQLRYDGRADWQEADLDTIARQAPMTGMDLGNVDFTRFIECYMNQNLQKGWGQAIKHPPLYLINTHNKTEV